MSDNNSLFRQTEVVGKDSELFLNFQRIAELFSLWSMKRTGGMCSSARSRRGSCTEQAGQPHGADGLACAFGLPKMCLRPAQEVLSDWVGCAFGWQGAVVEGSSLRGNIKLP